MRTNQFGTRSSLHLRRINWLKRNKKVWSAYSQTNWIDIEKELLARMKKAGLYPMSTTLLDVSFENLINKVRTQGRPKKKVARTNSL